MAKLRLAQFSGEIPRLLTRLLPETGAQLAENVRLDDGGLTPVRKSSRETSFSGAIGIQTIYKFGSTWLYWTTPVNAVPGPVATDRLYYTGDGAPKMRVGSIVYPLALAAPTAALTANLTGTGTGNITTRLYVYTWVTDYGEESPPCPVTADVQWQSGLTVTLSGFQAVPAGRAISKQRIYRSQSSSQNGTSLFFIEERAASTGNYVDTHSPTDFQNVLPSLNYDAPPSDLAGLIALPNGMMVGFSGKQLCFSEPYQPHAWPVKYRLTASYQIVGLGAYGTTIVAGTAGYPYVVSGNSPDSMVEQRIEVNLPCINGRGLVDLGYSVAYPSNDGLVVVSGSGASVVTDALFTRADWQKLSPSSIVSGQFSGRYFASFSYQNPDGTTSSGTRVIDLTGQQPFVLRYSFKADAFFYDIATGILYYAVGDTVYGFDALGELNATMSWTSKRFVLQNPASFGAILVESGALLSAEDQAAQNAAIAAIDAANAIVFASDMNAEIDGAAVNEFAFAGDALQSYPASKYTSVRVYANNKLLCTVNEMDKPKRIKPVLAREWEIQVNGTAEVEQITLATTARELTET
ncbi:hypothetical protein UFOVP275_18 [uncultured Caudovirales phage]|uniref:Uncharacterized protein n=1 Tax=uncultured Caudovirales phage TaxID=2100421 RepID=A0A6J5LJM8_9CAUD|nr:hypothetical protein UFOVP275_18 [uncultured Caudovirales phage]